MDVRSVLAEGVGGQRGDTGDQGIDLGDESSGILD
jgi:hypothetical protein